VTASGGLGEGRHLPHAAQIDAYGSGGFRFADMSHRGSLLCLPDGVWAWPVARADEIDRQALALVFAKANELDTLIVGTGTEIAPFPNELRQALRSVSVVVDVMQTGAAIRVYNIMSGERRRVAAALIAVP
jgi:uncharacterized protein